ncbi:Flavocytochrome c flavin subunit protein, partial [Haloplasma contractile SSD-17B]
MSAIGGNSVISDGGIAAPGTDMQKKEGIEYDPDLMYQDMLKSGQQLNDLALLRVLVDQAKDAFEWSRDYLGVEYLDRVSQFGGHSVPRCYTPKKVSGYSIIKKQNLKAKELGVDIRIRSKFVDFIQDSDQKVCGVTIIEGFNNKESNQGTKRFIKANKVVILATGGFGSDVEFRMAHDSRLTSEVDTTNKPFATAEALRSALELGATSIHLPLYKIYL